jgi:hypothetical protein
MKILTIAAGLLLTGVVGLVWCLVVGLVSIATETRAEVFVLWAVVLFGLGAVGALLAGAVQMMRLRSYPLAVAATLLAMLPWSPGWVLGLPFGIWGLVVLRRPKVQAAFLNNLRPTGPAAGKIGSFFRSVAGYFLTTFTRRKRKDIPSP